MGTTWLPTSYSWRPVRLRCSRCDTFLDELQAHLTVSDLNVFGSNHRPDGPNHRQHRVAYDVGTRPGGGGMIDWHRWRCRCGATYEVRTEKLAAAFIRAQHRNGDLVAGIDCG